MKINLQNIITVILIIVAALFLAVPNVCAQVNVQQRIESTPSDIPSFDRPIALLVGLHSKDLAYNEISALSGFEFLTVPYRSNIEELISQVNPAQIIIKHPSGFVGLYDQRGELVRGIQTINQGDINTAYVNATPPSIVQPVQAASPYSQLITHGSLTGSVPHGGLGYKAPPKGRGVLRHLLKLGALTGLVPFQYPGYFNAYSTYNTEKLVPSLLLPQVPLAIGAVSTIADAKLDEAEYDYARSQPRDYKFQPVIEGY